MTDIVRVNVVGRNVFPVDSSCRNLGVNGFTIAYHWKIVSCAYLPVNVLQARSVLLRGEKENNSRLVFSGKNLAHKAVVGVFVHSLVRVVYREFDNNNIGVIGKKLLVCAVNAEVGVRSADTCVDSVDLALGELFLPPREKSRSVAVVLI